MNTHTPTVRLRRAERCQVEMNLLSLDQMLSPDHVARVVWDAVKDLDVTPLLADVRSTEHHPGNPAIDPHVLIALWLLATIQGVGSAPPTHHLAEMPGRSRGAS